MDKYSVKMNPEFNNPNKYYCIGCSGYDFEKHEIMDYKIFENAVINENGEHTDFITGHAYAIIGADEEYVYMINPWNSSKKLKIEAEKLQSFKATVGVGWA